MSLPSRPASRPLAQRRTLWASPWRSPAFWLAVLAAMVLHTLLLASSVWWRLPWRMPNKQRPSLVVQLLPASPKADLPAAGPAEPTSNLSPPTPPEAASPPQTPAAADAEKPVRTRVQAAANNAPTNKAAPSFAPSLTPSLAPSPQPTPRLLPGAFAAPGATPLPAANDASETAPLALLHDMQAPDSVLLRYRVSNTEAANNPNADMLASPGSAQLSWQLQPQGRYLLVWQQSVQGKTLRQQSQGSLGATGLQPERYSEAGSGKSETATHFVAAKQQIIFSNNQPSAPLAAGAQDRLSVLMQLGGILAAQFEAQALAEQISLFVASSSEARLWRFQVLGLQPALAVAGAQSGSQWLAVRHDPSSDGGDFWEPTITVWYDTEGFLPMRLLLRYPNTRTLDAQLSSQQDLP